MPEENNQQDESKTGKSTQVTFHESVAANEGPSKKSNITISDELDIFDFDLERDADMIETILFYVGDMGIYQKWLFVWMMPFSIFFAWTYFSQMFILLTPQNYWCRVPELANLSMELRYNLSTPRVNGEWDNCHTYDTDWNKVIQNMKPPPANTPTIPCKNGWEFDLSDISYDTVVTEREWVCDRAGYIPTVQSLFFAGSIAGGLLFGWMADYLGRVPALMGVNIIGGIGGVATNFTNGFWDFVICRFLVGMSFDNCFMIIYILVLEYVAPEHRTWMANMPLALYYGAGAVILPWIAYYLANWRHFMYVTSLPMFIVLLAPWVMPESARWLVSRGKVKGASKVLEKFAKVNRTTIPEHIMDKFMTSSINMSKEKRESFVLIFQNKLLRFTVICMMAVYCSLAVVYDGLVKLSDSFGMDFFITFTINAAAEIPSILLLTLLLDRLGRRNLIWGPVVLAAIFMLIALMVPKGIPQVLFALLARFLINLTYTASIQWATEILPTPFRATGSAALHVCGFVFSLISPFIVFSQRLWSSLPLLILIATSLIAAVLSFLLPETKGQEMPQTVDDAEYIIKEGTLRGNPEIQQLKNALRDLLTSAVSEPVHRSAEGRVSRLLIEQSKSRLNLNN